VCTTGDTAHIDTIFKFLSHTRHDPCLQGHLALVGCAVYVPPLPCDLADLKVRIIAAVKNIDAPMLKRVWQELEYRIDVCRVTCDAHIENV
jgi:hypothetical protein